MMLEDLYRLLKTSHVQAQGIVDTLTVPLLVLDERFRIVTANNAFLKAFRIERDDIIEKTLFSLGSGQWDVGDLKVVFEMIIPKSAGVLGYQVTHDFPHIGKRSFVLDARRLVHPDDNSVNILVQFDDVTDRKRIEAEKDFVIAETRHRMRNVFSIIRAIVLQTQTDNRTTEEYRNALIGRIDTAMNAQQLSFGLHHTQFADLVETTISAAGPDRFRITTGPAAELQASRVLPVGMMIHELTTNAIKYGALSVPDGAVLIGWNREERNGKQLLVVKWREKNGPPCHNPERQGYGTELIRGTAAHLGGKAELTFNPHGLVATLEIPL
jgi:two-component sensor histidine kinase